MSKEKTLALAQLVAAQKSDPTTFSKLAPADLDGVKTELVPNDKQAFTADQRFWLERWWLPCTKADVDSINALLPANTRVEPLNSAGSLYLCADLKTDSKNYGKASAILAALPMTNLDIDAVKAEKVKAEPKK